MGEMFEQNGTNSSANVRPTQPNVTIQTLLSDLRLAGIEPAESPPEPEKVGLSVVYMAQYIIDEYGDTDQRQEGWNIQGVVYNEGEDENSFSVARPQGTFPAYYYFDFSGNAYEADNPQGLEAELVVDPEELRIIHDRLIAILGADALDIEDARPDREQIVRALRWTASRAPEPLELPPVPTEQPPSDPHDADTQPGGFTTFGSEGFAG